jgi:hypothetical protein
LGSSISPEVIRNGSFETEIGLRQAQSDFLLRVSDIMGIPLILRRD